MRSAINVCLFTLVAILAGARIARAEPGAVLVSGTAGERQQRIASSAVVTAVRAADWRVGGKSYNAADSAAAASCLRKPRPWTCIAAILRDKQILRVAVVAVDPKPGKHGSTDTVITARLVIANIDSLFVAQRFCDHCTEDKLAGLAAEVTKELIDRAAVGSGRTVLSIQSTPRGARAYVDANLVGVTDASINIVPGDHTVTVELDDHKTATRRVTVGQDTTEEISFTLQPSPAASGDPRESPGSRRARLVPALIAGAGTAAFVTGAVLLALDQDPVTRPGEDVPPRYRDSGTRGVLIGVSGLAIAGVGGYLWWSASRPAPVVAPVAGGAVVGFTRSF
jgi:hypothetical protein